MPSRVRVAGLIGGRAYFGRHILGYLRNVADSAGVLMSNRKKGATWQDILAAWEVVARYIEGSKLYVIRERRGVHSSRSLFNQKLLGYRRKKKKKVAKLPAWAREAARVGQAENPFWNNGQVPPAEGVVVVVNDAPEQLAGAAEAVAPPPEQPRAARRARQVELYVDWQGNIVKRFRD